MRTPMLLLVFLGGSVWAQPHQDRVATRTEEILAEQQSKRKPSIIMGQPTQSSNIAFSITISPNPSPAPPGDSLPQKMQARAQAQRELNAAINNGNNYRWVSGKLYNVALARDWITIPSKLERGSFKEQSAAGPVFAIEKQVNLGWVTDRTIAITNYPGKEPRQGELMPAVRVLPLNTTNSSGFQLFDYGTIPVKTNSAAQARSAATPHLQEPLKTP